MNAVKVQLVPVEVLRPHEEVIPKNVDQLERMTLKWDAYTKPLLVDRSTGTILDGHHRYEIAKRLELKCLPCVLVDYLSDESIKIILWPNSKWTSMFNPVDHVTLSKMLRTAGASSDSAARCEHTRNFREASDRRIKPLKQKTNFYVGVKNHLLSFHRSFKIRRTSSQLPNKWAENLKM